MMPALAVGPPAPPHLDPARHRVLVPPGRGQVGPDKSWHPVVAVSIICAMGCAKERRAREEHLP